MNVSLDAEHAEIDALWRERFGQPLPVLGCTEMARQLLKDASEMAACERRTALRQLDATP